MTKWLCLTIVVWDKFGLKTSGSVSGNAEALSKVIIERESCDSVSVSRVSDQLSADTNNQMLFLALRRRCQFDYAPQL